MEEEIKKILKERDKELRKLLKERDRFIDVLRCIEEAYLDGWISKKEYERIRGEYERRLGKTEEKLSILPPIKKPKIIAPPPKPTYPSFPFWLVVVGLLGGVFATIGLFLPWASLSEVMENENVIKHEDITGFDMPKVSREYPQLREISFAVLSALVGGALILIGLVGRLLGLRTGAGVFAGGILAAIGGIWGSAKLSGGIKALRLINPDISLSIGLGVYLVVVGAILAVLGFIGLIIRK